MTDKEACVYQVGLRLFQQPTTDAELRTLHKHIVKLRDSGVMNAQDIGDFLCDGTFDACAELLRMPMDPDAIATVTARLAALTNPLLDTPAAKPKPAAKPATPLRVTSAAQRDTPKPAAKPANTRKTR